MTDAATIQAVRLFPVVLLPVLAVPLRLAVHRTRAVLFLLVPAVPLRLAVQLIRIVQLLLVPAVPLLLAVHRTRAVQHRLVPAVQTPAVLLLPATAVATSVAKAVRLKMRARSPS